MALLITLALMIELVISGHARTLQLNYPPQRSAEPLNVFHGNNHNYDDSYVYDASKSMVMQAAAGEKDSPSSPLQEVFNDYQNYDYFYGDPNYHYEAAEGRSTDEESETRQEYTDVPRLDDGDEVVYATPPEGVNPVDQGTLVSTTVPEGVSPVDQGAHHSTTAPEGGHHDQEEKTGSSMLLNWVILKWNKAKEKVLKVVGEVQEVKKSVTQFMYKFAELMDEGAQYCIHKLRYAARELDSRATKVLEKLEEKLREGNEKVAAFFRLIGTKVHEWGRQHEGVEIGANGDMNGTENMGMMGISVAGSVDEHSDVSQYQGDGSLENKLPQDVDLQSAAIEDMPNFFQDEAVLEKFDELVREGILTAEEVEAVLESA
ncbi:uncharacterized protein [Cherax quadricarinatus]